VMAGRCGLRGSARARSAGARGRRWTVRRATLAMAEPAPFVIGHPAPDSLLLGFHRPLQALQADCASAADRLGLLDLAARGRAGADRKEELWVLIRARALLTPVHRFSPLRRHCTDIVGGLRFAALADRGRPSGLNPDGVRPEGLMWFASTVAEAVRRQRVDRPDSSRRHSVETRSYLNAAVRRAGASATGDPSRPWESGRPSQTVSWGWMLFIRPDTPDEHPRQSARRTGRIGRRVCHLV
jgi:hypothetical protein